MTTSSYKPFHQLITRSEKKWLLKSNRRRLCGEVTYGMLTMMNI